MVPSSGPGADVAGAEERVDLVVGQVGDEFAVEQLDRDGQDTLDRAGVLGVAERGVGEQRVDRRKAVVAGTYAVASYRLQVLQEGDDEGGVQVTRPFPRAVGGEAQQQTVGVSVGRDGVGACSPLDHQALREERFECWGEGGHRRTPAGWVPRRCATSSISSGDVLMYQYVSVMSTCPRYVDKATMRVSTSMPERYHEASTRTVKECRRSWIRGLFVSLRRPVLTARRWKVCPTDWGIKLVPRLERKKLCDRGSGHSRSRRVA